MTIWHVLAVLVIVLNIIFVVMDFAHEEYVSAGCSVLCIVLSAVYLLSNPIEEKVKDINQKINSYQLAGEMIADGCKVYLDGQEVDPDVIILEDYKITIKDDFVILSRK